MGARSQRVHSAIFRLLLRLYPSAFRAAYGDEMTSYFLSRLARARGRGRLSASREWLRGLLDVARTALAERRSVRRWESGGGSALTSLLQDIGYAARRLGRTPLFALFAVSILALGIGLNAAVFGVVDALLLRPAPFADASSIVHVYQDSDDGEPSSTSFPTYREMAQLNEVFAGVAANTQSGAALETGDGSRQVAVEYATASYLPVLGLRPHLGRWFDAAHDHVGSELVAVVSHRTWRTQFGGDPDMVGRTVRLNNQSVTVIGVGPTEFNGEAGSLLTDFWLSISSTPVGGPYQVANLDREEDHWYLVKARLAPGVGLGAAQAAMDALALRRAELFPELNRGRAITVFAHDAVRFHPAFDGPLRLAGVGLFTVSGLVLLLACANLANLLLVRGLARRPELAVRLALGAGRGRVARLLLVEALLLSVTGAVAGVALGAWSLRFFPALPLPIPGGGLDVGFDHRMVVFGAVLALLTGTLFGALPALRVTRGNVADSLRDEGRGATGGRGVRLLRGGLVAVQVTVSMVLVVAAGLLARGLSNTERVSPGFDADRLAVVATNLGQAGITDALESDVVAAQILERAATLPGVESVALTTRLPVSGGGSTTQVVDGYEPVAGTGAVELDFAAVSAGYFETVGIPLKAGRTFSAEDRAGGPRVVIVNETAARLFWGGDAIGGRLRAQSVPDGWREVIGVVGDARVSSLGEAPTPFIYYAAAQSAPAAFNIVVRSAGDPAALIAPLRAAVREVRPTLPIVRATTLEAHLGDALAGPRLGAALMGSFSLLALLLAGLGIYAVVAHSVEQRRRELGIRCALGAARPRLIATVVGHTLLVVAFGAATGLLLAAFATRGLEGMFYGVGALDPLAFGGAALLLLATGGAAALIPARRAAAADPVDVLRDS
jgi:predicted permease